MRHIYRIPVLIAVSGERGIASFDDGERPFGTPGCIEHLICTAVDTAESFTERIIDGRYVGFFYPLSARTPSCAEACRKLLDYIGPTDDEITRCPVCAKSLTHTRRHSTTVLDLNICLQTASVGFSLKATTAVPRTPTSVICLQSFARESKRTSNFTTDSMMCKQELDGRKRGYGRMHATHTHLVRCKASTSL